MSDTISDTVPEAPSGPPQKRLTFSEFAAVIHRTPLEIWTTLLKSKYGYSAMTKHEWLRTLDTVSRGNI